MKKKITVSTAITLLILTAALAISVTMMLAIRYFNRQVQSVSQRQAMYAHINGVDKKVREYYPELDEELLRQSITKGYISGIGDSYAACYSPDDYVAEKLRMSGYSKDIGVQVNRDAKGNMVVSRVSTDSAADKAGLKTGDVIVALDGTDIGSVSSADLQAKLDSAEKVLISAKRGDQSLAFELTPFQYEIRSAQGTMKDSVGYIRVTAFYENTADQLKATVSALLEGGATALVFDLRDNVGGSGETLEEILSFLMPLGQYGTRTAKDGTVTKLSSTGSSQLSIATTTLINKVTAGEAELFAGALQDFGLTTVIGETSAGKAKYQEYFVLDSDSSALRLTAGEYSLIKSGSWENVGIKPDVPVALTDQQRATASTIELENDPYYKMALNQMGVAIATGSAVNVGK